MRRLLVALTLLSSFPAAAKGLIVSPSRLSVSAAAGLPVEETLSLTPATAERTRVTVAVEAFGLDADGKPWRGAGGETPRSMPSLLDVSPRALVLENGERAPLRVRMTPPASALGSYWAAIVLEVEPVETAGAGSMPIDVVTRLVVPVFVTVERGSSPRLAIEDLVARSTGNGAIEIIATVENPGSAVVRTLAYVVLEEPGPGGPVELAAIEVKGLTLLPGFPRRIRVTLKPSRAPGMNLAARVIVPYGERLAESEGAVRP